MPCALVKRLGAYADLTPEETTVLERASSRSQLLQPRTDLVCEGDAPAHVHLVTSGLACRYKLLGNGQRQIISYLIPGDCCDVDVFSLMHMDHSIATLSPVLVAWLPRDQMIDLMRYAGIGHAMRLAKLADEAALREGVTNIGQRSAAHRLAHLFCELYLRMKTVGLANDLEFEFPVTQTDLGDTLGLSTVHVNRSLQALKAAEIVSFKSKKVVIANIERMRKLSGFRDNYLHLRSAESSLAA